MIAPHCNEPIGDAETCFGATNGALVFARSRADDDGGGGADSETWFATVADSEFIVGAVSRVEAQRPFTYHAVGGRGYVRRHCRVTEIPDDRLAATLEQRYPKMEFEAVFARYAVA